jgi:hypothetical protein
MVTEQFDVLQGVGGVGSSRWRAGVEELLWEPERWGPWVSVASYGCSRRAATTARLRASSRFPQVRFVVDDGAGEVLLLALIDHLR